MEKQNYDFLFKILIIGDSGVGKTCILSRFTKKNFIEKHITTSGREFNNKILKVENKPIKLQIWDTSGLETSHSYYKGAMGIIITYDISDINSFQDVRNWMTQIDIYSPNDTCKVLVGNKSDKIDRAVSHYEGQSLAEEFGISFFETSAKEPKNIDEVFNYLTKEILKKKSK